MTQTEIKIPNYKNLQVGQRFYYTGDMANSPAFGEITALVPATKYSPYSYKVKFDEDQKESEIYCNAFDKSVGQRFKTIEQYNEERRQAMERLYQQFPHLKK